MADTDIAPGLPACREVRKQIPGPVILLVLQAHFAGKKKPRLPKGLRGFGYD